MFSLISQRRCITVAILALFAFVQSSCTKTPAPVVPTMPSAFCDVTYKGNTYKFDGLAFKWSINSNSDTVVELNNTTQYFQIRSLKFSSVTSWVGTFDDNQNAAGNILNANAKVNYIFKGDTMVGSCTFDDVSASFRLLRN